MPLKRYLQYIIVTERVDVFRRSDTREENIFGVFYFTHWLKVTAVVPAEDKKKTQQGLKTDCSKIQSMFIFLFLPAAVCVCVCATFSQVALSMNTESSVIERATCFKCSYFSQNGE